MTSSGMNGLEAISKLLGLGYTATTLDSFLASKAAFAGFQAYLADEDIQSLIFNSQDMMDVIAESSLGLKACLNTAANRLTYLSNADFLATVQATVNSSTFIKRDTVTATGTWTPPVDGVEIMYVCAVGPGGAGGDASGTHGGTGGSGAEVAGLVLIGDDIPTSGVSVTIPTSSGSPTTFGSLLSATSGVDGTTATGNTGGGTDSNLSNLITDDLDSAVFQLNAFSRQGSAGGDRNAGTGDGDPGVNGLTGSGGAGAVDSTSASVGGTGIASGGGGGLDGTVGHLSFINGGNSSAPGCGGGGGSDSSGTSGTGGTGGDGKVWVYYIQSRP